MGTILVTGATGNVGEPVVRLLAAQGESVRAAVRVLAPVEDQLRGVDYRPFDFAKPETYQSVLDGVDRIFLMRPPAIANTRKLINPFVDMAKEVGVRQIVFLSLLGAERNPVVPHRAVEDHILATGLAYTFLRPGFFMQNLNTTHGADIAERDEIFIPAGSSKTTFVDTRDIATVAAKVLTEPGHEKRAYPLTGSEAFTYHEIAAMMTGVLERPIRYTNPSLPRFAVKMRQRGYPFGFVMVMVALYTVGRLGLAATVTPDLGGLLGRPPTTVRQYIEDYKQEWQR